VDITETITIEDRYCGPPDSANGGYAAGLLAQHMTAAPQWGTWTEVTLRAPIPMGRPLPINAGPPATVADAATTVMEGRILAGDPPEGGGVPPVPLAQARKASRHYRGLTSHPFPTCWVCGPGRAPHDGLHLYPGLVEPGRTACVWEVQPGHARPDGIVPATSVWSALDCPGAWTVLDEGVVMLLGRIAASVEAVPDIGDECVVMGALIGVSGRKVFTATSAYAPDGAPLGHAVATWITLPGSRPVA